VFSEEKTGEIRKKEETQGAPCKTLKLRLEGGKAGLEFFAWKFLNKSDQLDFDVFVVRKRAQTVGKTVLIKTNSLEVAA
jgi:hypothetical protein